MGRHASANLFYGHILDEKRAVRLLKRLGTDVDPNEEDLGEEMGWLAREFDFELVFVHTGETYTKYGVAVFVKRTASYQRSKFNKFKLPSEIELTRRWKKINATLPGFAKTRAGWHLTAEYS